MINFIFYRITFSEKGKFKLRQPYNPQSFFKILKSNKKILLFKLTEFIEINPEIQCLHSLNYINSLFNLKITSLLERKFRLTKA